MITSLVTSTGAVLLWPSNQAAAITTVDQMSMTDKAKSFVYYKALSKCISDNSLKDNRGTSPSASLAAAGISEEHASSGDWFWDGAGSSPNVDIGYTLGNTSQNTVSCNDGWISDAAAVWGYSNAVDLLCDTGAQRVSGQDCRAGSGWFKGGWSAIGVVGERLVLETFQSNIKNKVYNGDEPGMPQEAWYIYWRNTFYTGCLGTMSPTIWTGAADNFTYTVEVPNSNWDGGTHSETYYGQRTGSSSIASTAVGSLTCQQLAQEVNNNAPAYALWAKDNSGAAAKENLYDPGTGEPTTTCAIDGLGWAICPIMTLLSSIADQALSILKNFLVTEPELVTNTGTQKAWAFMRNIANVLLIIFFMVIIFSQVTSIGIDNYGIKKMLPKLIIAAILINLSFILCQLAVDVSNIVGASLGGALNGIDVGSTTGQGTFDYTSVIGIIIAGTGAAAGIMFALLAVSVPVLLAAVVAVAVTLAILIARQAIIVIMIVLAPLAFAAYMLPNTENLFKKWGKVFVGLLVVYPTVALLYAGSDLASRILVSIAGDNIFMQLAALGAAALPLLLTPTLLKGSLNATGKVGAWAAGVASKRYGAMGGAVKDKSMLGAYKAGFDRNQQFKRQQVHGGTYKKGFSGLMSRQVYGRLNASKLTGDIGTRTAQQAASQAAGIEEENLKGAKSQIANLNIDNDAVATIARGGSYSGISGKDTAARAAAMETLLERGAIGDVKDANGNITTRGFESSWNSMLQDNKSAKGKETMRIAANAIAQSKSKPAFFGAGTLQNVRLGNPQNADLSLRTLAKNGVKDNRYSPQVMTAVSREELDYITEGGNNIPINLRQAANRAVTTDEINQHIGRNRDYVEYIAGTSGIKPKL